MFPEFYAALRLRSGPTEPGTLEEITVTSVYYAEKPRIRSRGARGRDRRRATKKLKPLKKGTSACWCEVRASAEGGAAGPLVVMR
jgi:hypothetical protein